MKLLMTISYPTGMPPKKQIIQELRVARHRASSDARVLQLTWLRTYDEAKKQTV